MFDVSSRKYGFTDAKTLELQVSGIFNDVIAIGGVEGVILASREGFPMFSRQTSQLDDDSELLVAAMLSGLMSTVEGATGRMGRSASELVTIESSDGYIVICDTFDGVVLAVTTNKTSKLGLIHYIIHHAKKRLVALLSTDREVEGIDDNAPRQELRGSN